MALHRGSLKNGLKAQNAPPDSTKVRSTACNRVTVCNWPYSKIEVLYPIGQMIHKGPAWNTEISMDFTVNNTMHIVLAWLKIISEMGSNCTTTNKQCNLLKNRTESWPDRQQKSAASRYPAGFHHAPSSLRARGHLLLPPANNSCHSYGTPLFFCIFNIFSRLTRNNTTVLYSCLLFSELLRVAAWPPFSRSLFPARLR